ncbi:MAG: S26 family signal peptidase [Campylobacterota bacterium]|nr:S26 family signal peptidase [Campylobacterota bacterium]
MSYLKHLRKSDIAERFNERILSNRRFYILLVVGTIFWMSALFAFKQNFNFHVNLTPSLPFTFLVTNKTVDNTDLTKRAIVEFPLGFDSPYKKYKKDSMFAKQLACVPGDLLETKGLEYYCNDFLIATALTHDSKGKAITQYFNFNGVVPEGQYFARGIHSHSYDSRYWGFLEKKQITGVGVWQY